MNLWMTSRVFPASVPNRDPLPSLPLAVHCTSFVDSLHDDEAPLRIVLEQLLQCLDVESAVAHVQRAAVSGKCEGMTHVLIGLNGVKANEIFFSLPSSFNTVPTNTQRPLSGTAGQLRSPDGHIQLTPVEQLQLLLRRRDGGQDGQPGVS